MENRKGWKNIDLGTICSNVTDGTHNTPTYTKSGIPFISVKDIYDEKVHFTSCRYVSHETHKELIKRCYPEPGDLLITKSGTIGRMAIVPDGPEFSLFVSVALLKNHKKVVNSRYLLFTLENYINSINIGQEIKGGLLKNFHLEDLRVTEIPLSPLPEQRAIVAKIEQLFSDLDNGIANLKKAQEQLKIYRQAVLKKAFEGELTRKWRAEQTDLPSAEELLLQIKEEREKHYQKQLDEWKKAVKEWEGNGKEGKKPSKPKKSKELPPLSEEELKELPELPEGWCYNKLGFVTRKAVKVKNSEQDKNSDFIYLDIGGIDKQTNKIISHKRYKWRDAPSRAQQIVHVGDTLFSTVRTYLKNIAIVEKEEYDQQICSSGFTVIRGFKKIIKSKFIFYLCIYESFIQPLNKLQTGTSYPAVRDDDVFKQPVPICSKAEQYEIVKEIETRLSVCDKLEATITESLQKSEALRQSILKRAFEGKLLNEKELEEARNAPDWEPADKLLERIKAEKEKPGNKKSFF